MVILQLFLFLCLFLQPGGVGSVVVGGARRDGGEVADEGARAAAVGGMAAGCGGCRCGAYGVLVYGLYLHSTSNVPVFDLFSTCFRPVMYLLGTSWVLILLSSSWTRFRHFHCSSQFSCCILSCGKWQG